MERWNFGIVEEGALRRDERLLVLGTQTRAPPGVAIRFPHFIRRRRIREGGRRTRFAQ